MNKKLIALALTALPVAAMADVTIYGTIKGAVENDRTKGSASVNRVEDYGSRIGFKGSEDIGNGLKAIWQVESGVSIDGTTGSDGNKSSSGWGGRQSFIGLSGGFGAVLLGNLDGQLKTHQEFDPWEYSHGVNGMNTYTRNDVRVKNAIAYQSPNWEGFDFLVAYSTDPIEAERRNETDVNRYATQVGLNYKHDSGFFGNYSYQNIGNSRIDNNGKSKNSDQHRITAGYDANNWLVVLSYQQIKGFNAAYDNAAINAADTTPNVNASNLKAKEAAFTIAYSFGAITPKFSYAHGWELKSSNGGGKLADTDYNQYVVGVDYALSKRTVAGIAYGFQKYGNEDIIGKRQTAAVNMVHSF